MDEILVLGVAGVVFLVAMYGRRWSSRWCGRVAGDPAKVGSPSEVQVPTDRSKAPPTIGGDLATRLATWLWRSRHGAGSFEALEEALLGADVGSEIAKHVADRMRERLGLAQGQAAREALREAMLEVLGQSPAPPPTSRPWVVLVVGVNGVGKTTTIGKLAAWYQREGRKPLLVAGDTFRAAAGEQLVAWGARLGVDVVRHAPGGDPCAVAFDGLRAAMARSADVVLIDSAGRLHTRETLMEELGRIRRVIAKGVLGAPHETLLVLDATTGQNALSQARAFSRQVAVSGVVLTKLDGTARGGMILAVRKEIGVPIRWVGLGESVDDLRPFDPAAFVDGILTRSRGDLDPGMMLDPKMT